MGLMRFFKNKNEIKQRNVKLVDNTLINLLLNQNPQNKLNDDDMDMIRKDLTFLQSDLSRKSVSEQKELVIVSENETINLNLKKYFKPDIVSQILETYLYGINVFEVNWKQKDDLFYPILVQRDFRNFALKDGHLKFKTLSALEDIPNFKAIYGLSRANFKNTLGDGLLEKLYFPIKIKNAGLKFWISFLEKFGSPWAIAKTDMNADELADEVYNMLNGDTAVITPEESIELIQPQGTLGFKEIIEYCDTKIAKVILGANLSADVQGGSFAASSTHNTIREQIAKNDENILLFILNKAVRYFKEINNLDLQIEVKFLDENKNKDLAERDRILFDMGFKPTKDYIKKVYGLEIDESYNNFANRLNADLLAFKQPLNSKQIKYLDKFDKALDETNFTEDLKKGDKELQKSLDEILKECKTYEEAFSKFSELYSNYPLQSLEEIMFKAIANANLLGLIDA